MSSTSADFRRIARLRHEEPSAIAGGSGYELSTRRRGTRLVGSLPCGFRKPQIRAYRWCRPTKDRLRDNVPEPLNRTCAGCVLAKRKVRPHPVHGDPPRSLALLDIPIIGMSAHAVESERERAIATGCDEFDAKPIEFESLVATIRRVLAPHK